MARYVFGKAIDEGDVMELQGVEYHLQPIGMRAMRAMLAKRQMIEAAERGGGSPEQVDALIDLVVAAVVSDERVRMREQIEESVDTALLAQVASALMRGMSDLDPTQLTSSFNGSSPTGPTSTDGAVPTASIPSASPSAES
jgi:hypothetical protein